MADTKNTQGNTPDTQGNAPEKKTENAKEKKTENAKEKKTENAKEELVSVFIPKQSRGDTERFIAVNGERILVQTGKNVKIPERFAEVIRNSEKMSAVAEEYINDNIMS